LAVVSITATRPVESLAGQNSAQDTRAQRNAALCLPHGGERAVSAEPAIRFFAFGTRTRIIEKKPTEWRPSWTA
jgi:hypothetical protein